MLFGIEKCKTLCTAKENLEIRNFTTEDNDTMEVMNEDDIYRYLDHLQAKQIKHAPTKHKLREKYLNRKKSILKTKRMEKYGKSNQYLCDSSTNF